MTEVDGPMKVYVGGLTEQLADITENDLRNIFPFGEIDYFDLHKDPNTGKCKGKLAITQDMLLFSSERLHVLKKLSNR